MLAVRLLLALLIGAAVLVGIVFAGLFFGGADCHAGQCNWFGEFIDDTRPVYLILAALAGLLTGWWAWRKSGANRR